MSLDFLFVIGEDGQIIHSNSIVQTRLGYSLDVQLYAEWGVDYVKVDDLLYLAINETGEQTGHYHHDEIKAIRKAIDGCDRNIVFSLSPGNLAPVEEAEFLKQHTDLWRVSEDFWDELESLKRQFL